MRGLPDKLATPTISRVHSDTIVELVYDREKRATALVVSRFDGLWNVEQELVLETGERLVPYSAKNNLIAHECVLFASKPEACGTQAEVLAEIETFLHRYVDLSAEFAQIAAHYVLFTWVHDAFSEVPYLRLRGDYGTGKTRALLAIGSLCYKPFFAAGASTVSPIFHTLDRFGGTLILDEADFRFSDATTDLVKIFNNGTVKGVPVLRTLMNREKEFNPTAFNVFGPKIVAMRGAFADEALESRFLTEETGRHRLRTDIPLHLPPEFRDEALSIRNQLLQFRLTNRFSIALDPAAVAADLEPRLNQIAAPLLSLTADSVVRENIKDVLRCQQESVRAGRRESLEGRVLQAVLAVGGARVISVQAVTDTLNQWSHDQHPISARHVGAILRGSFGVRTRKSHGSYVFVASERERLQNIAERYGIAQSTSERSSGAVS